MKSATICLTIVMAAALLLVGTFTVEAQSGDKVYRIGVLSPTDGRNPFDDTLERRLGDLGWVKGRNVRFSYRYSRVNDVLPPLAKELEQERVDIIVTSGTPASLAAKQATTTIPVVFYSVGDPVALVLSRASAGLAVTSPESAGSRIS